MAHFHGCGWQVSFPAAACGLSLFIAGRREKQKTVKWRGREELGTGITVAPVFEFSLSHCYLDVDCGGEWNTLTHIVNLFSKVTDCKESEKALICLLMQPRFEGIKLK